MKLCGFRIELGEIENTSSRYPGIAQVAAAVHREQLVLYFTADRRIDQKALRTFLSDTLTEYMVPTVYVQLDEMPITANGKIDRRKLPEPERQGSYEEPATPMERELCEQYAKILCLKKVGALDSFFEISGNSISASYLLTCAMGKGYPVAYKDIFKNPTPRQLAAVITGAVGVEHSRQAADYDYSRIKQILLAYPDEVDKRSKNERTQVNHAARAVSRALQDVANGRHHG